MCPCESGLSSILRVVGLLRPESICKAVGSGRRPLPLFTALKESNQQSAQESGQPQWLLCTCENSSSFFDTIVWAAIRAANMLLPGGPGAQKDTLMCVPPSNLPSVSRCASSAISAVANSNTANRRKLPSCPWANCREEKHLTVDHTISPSSPGSKYNTLKI